MRNECDCVHVYTIYLRVQFGVTLTFRVRVRNVPVKPSFSAVKVPMFAMMNFLSVEQGSRPSRPVVIRSVGDGLAAPLAGAT